MLTFLYLSFSCGILFVLSLSFHITKLRAFDVAWEPYKHLLEVIIPAKAAKLQNSGWSMC